MPLTLGSLAFARLQTEGPSAALRTIRSPAPSGVKAVQAYDYVQRNAPLLRARRLIGAPTGDVAPALPIPTTPTPTVPPQPGPVPVLPPPDVPLAGGAGDPGSAGQTTPSPGGQPMIANPFTPTDIGLGTGITGVQIGGSGGTSVSGTIFGVPVTIGGSGGKSVSGAGVPVTIGGGSEPAGQSPVPGELQLVPTSGGDGECPGLTSIKVGGKCVDLGALPPGGAPAITGQVQTGQMGGYGDAVVGLYGVGLIPRVDVQTVRRCPPGMALGKDGVCYDGLGRNSPRRAWRLGPKPLMTPGDRNAIRRALRVGNALKRAKKNIAKAGRALEMAAGKSGGGRSRKITKAEASRVLRS